VRDKDDLLGAMCDRLLVGLDPIDLDRSWEPQLRRLAEQVREHFIARPALLPALAAAPVTPMSLLVAADAVGLLVRAGASAADAAVGVNAVFSYVLGHAVTEAAVPAPSDHEALRDAALAYLATDDPPRHLDAAIDLMSDAGDFHAGLDLVLSGLRLRLGRERLATTADVQPTSGPVDGASTTHRSNSAAF
jgi:TetR/AcrR family transcriptional regulator, tetracycline repressor protein